jgi:uncharacterized protein YndB with AHSA1/START domain
MTTLLNPNPDFLDHEFLITREFDAPRALVFQAWTDPKQLAQWWGPRGFTNPVCELDVRPGGAIYVVMTSPNGDRYPMGGEFREITFPERLVLTTGALDDQGNLMFELLHTLTFTEQNGKTTLTLKSRVIKTTPGAGRYIGGFEAGMTQSLVKLSEQVDCKAEPLLIERTFNAPIDLVWHTISTPEGMKHWFFELKAFEAEVGFQFSFTGGKDGQTFLHLCTVAEVVVQKRLSFTWRYDGYTGNSLVVIELFPEGRGTRVRLTHHGLETFPTIPIFDRANFNMGWTHIIGTSLKEAVETKANI